MRAIIIDDEKNAIASLEMELKEITPEIEIIGTADSVKSGIELLKKKTPNILFLDIQLKDGLGFDILEDIASFGEFRVVFTTAYDQYAVNAFKHGAFDYLLKPIDPDDLQLTIDRIIKMDALKKTEFPIDQLDQIIQLTSKIGQEAKIALSTTEGVFLKKIASIIHIQADGNYTKFYFEGIKKSMLISRILKDFESILKDYGFVRVHFSHLINLNHLESYHPKDGGHVMMSNKSLLPVSVRKKSNLLEILRNRTQFPI